MPNRFNTPCCTFTVLGAGTWGATLADLLARNGHEVCCWDVSTEIIDHLNTHRKHPRLDDFVIADSLRFTASLPDALAGARVCVMVVPSAAVRSVCQRIKTEGLDRAIEAWVICSKGVEQKTNMLMHEVLRDTLGPEAAARAGVLSGPSHAEEVSRRMPTTVVAAAADPRLAENIQQWFFRPYLRVYTSDDILGVELGGAIKNVIAIAAGVSDGLGFGDNARAALMTRGLAEIVRLGLAAGAQLETFMGLSGIGDLIVTAGSRHSRNHSFGELLARDYSVPDALQKVGMVVEGYATAPSARELARRHSVEMPIAEAVYQVLYCGLPARRAVEELLARDPKPEHVRAPN